MNGYFLLPNAWSSTKTYTFDIKRTKKSFKLTQYEAQYCYDMHVPKPVFWRGQYYEGHFNFYY